MTRLKSVWKNSIFHYLIRIGNGGMKNGCLGAFYYGPLGDFKVTTPEILLLSQQAVTSKKISVPYTNLQLNPYPNIQLDLFCTKNLSFWCTAPSMWLTNYADPSTWLQSPTREVCWLQSSSAHPNEEDQEDSWLQNPTVHKHSNFFTRMMN